MSSMGFVYSIDSAYICHRLFPCRLQPQKSYLIFSKGNSCAPAHLFLLSRLFIERHILKLPDHIHVIGRDLQI